MHMRYKNLFSLKCLCSIDIEYIDSPWCLEGALMPVKQHVHRTATAPPSKLYGYVLGRPRKPEKGPVTSRPAVATLPEEERESLLQNLFASATQYLAIS